MFAVKNWSQALDESFGLPPDISFIINEGNGEDHLKKKKIQNLLSGHWKGPRPSTNTTSIYKTRESHVTKTHSLTYLLKYVDSCTDILY